VAHPVEGRQGRDVRAVQVAPIICRKCKRRVYRPLIRDEWCSSCYSKGLREGEIEKLPGSPSIYRVEDWIEDFKILYSRAEGPRTRAQFASAMGMKLCTFDQKLNRARKAGLLSKRYTLPKERY
jgi:hypothetical protein